MKRSWILLAALLLAGCGNELQWYVVSPTTAAGRTNLWFMLTGLKYTILLSLTAIIISVIIGLLVALPGLASNPVARAFNRVYVEIVRAIPLLVLILWVYYGLPIMMDININVFWAGVIALALSDSAFEAEIFRAGIQSIDRGQLEASDSIGLGYVDRMRYVVLPQAIRRVLPPLGNQLVYMLKMSSLVSVIGMEELTKRANQVVTAEYRPLETYTVLILEYLVLIMIVSAGVRWLERRMAQKDAAEPPTSGFAGSWQHDCGVSGFRDSAGCAQKLCCGYVTGIAVGGSLRNRGSVGYALDVAAGFIQIYAGHLATGTLPGPSFFTGVLVSGRRSALHQCVAHGDLSLQCTGFFSAGTSSVVT